MDEGVDEAGATRRDDGAAKPGPLDLVTALLDSANAFARSVAVSQAAQLAAIREAVVTAQRNPEAYVPEASQTPAIAASLAARAVVMELSWRLSLSESAIWGQFHEADTLIGRLPLLWAMLCSGAIGYRNAHEAAQVAWTLPTEDPAVFNAYDELLAGKASLTPTQFRKAARAARERLHPRDPAERHVEARQERRIEIEPGNDSMGWISLHTDAATIMKIDARLNAAARRQRDADGETRTLAQLRADAAGDILTGRGTPWEVKARVHLNAPATILLNNPELLKQAHTDRALLEGYGPIDDDTARLLIADAPSFRRVFTDPITGVDLNMDRNTYRPTKAQREWLRRQHPDCGSPTCTIRIDDADIDHTIDWYFHGPTNEDNLLPLSRGHHTVKHKTKMSYTHTPEGTIRWRSPTGYQRDSDPPPF